MKRIFFLLVFILVGCGGDIQQEQSFNYYQERTIEPKNLDLTIKASGEIEAVYSVEIKSKASGVKSPVVTDQLAPPLPTVKVATIAVLSVPDEVN